MQRKRIVCSRPTRMPIDPPPNTNSAVNVVIMLARKNASAPFIADAVMVISWPETANAIIARPDLISTSISPNLCPAVTMPTPTIAASSVVNVSTEETTRPAVSDPAESVRTNLERTLMTPRETPMSTRVITPAVEIARRRAAESWPEYRFRTR